MFFKGPTTHNCAGKSKRISHCKWQSGKHVETKWFGGPSESKSKTTSLLVGIVLFYTLNALLLAIHKECMPWIVIGGCMSWRKTSCGLQPPPPPVLHDRMHHLATQLGLMEEMTSAMLNPPTSLSIPQHPSASFNFGIFNHLCWSPLCALHNLRTFAAILDQHQNDSAMKQISLPCPQPT